MESQASATKLAEKLDSAAKIQSFSLILSKFRAKLSEVVSEASALKNTTKEQEKIISDLKLQLSARMPRTDVVVDPELRDEMNKYALIVQENENLKRELSHAKTLAEAKGAANDECAHSLYEATVLLKEKTRVNELLSARVTNFESQMETFEKRSESIRNDVREITKQFVQYKEVVAANVKIQRGSAEKIQRLTDQLESKQRVVQERDAAIKQLNLVIHDKDYAAEQQNRQLRILTNDVALAKSSAVAAQKRVDDMILEKQKILASFTTLDGSLADARAVIAKQQATCLQRSNEYTKLKLQYEKIQSLCRDDSARIRELEDYAAKLHADQEQKIKDLLAIQQNHHAANQGTMNSLQETLKSLQKKYAEGTQREEELKLECATLRAKLEPLEERLPRLSVELNTAHEKLAAAERDVQSVRAELEFAKQQQAVSVPTEPAAPQPEVKPIADQLPEDLLALPQQEEASPPPALASPAPLATRTTEVASPRPQPRVAKSASSSLAAAASYAAIAAPSAAPPRPAKRLPTQFHSRTEEAEEELDDLSSFNCCASCNAPSYGYMVSCVGCKKQFHASCVAISSVESKFHCASCKQNSKTPSKRGKTSAAKGSSSEVMKIASFV